MEILKFIIDDNTIAKLLGVQNFTRKESAILELVKNSYDAQATFFNITFETDKITIKDNGSGMNAQEIKENWMCIGKSKKEYEIIDNQKNKRVLAGSKGIGRFALARLGSSIEINSQKNDTQSKKVLWKTDWIENTLEENNSSNECGTEIIITTLQEKWNQKSIDELIKYLSRCYNDTLMTITINFENNKYEVPKCFIEPLLGNNCVTKINFNYSARSQELSCSVTSDEFKDEAKKYCKNINMKNFTTSIKIFNELENQNEINIANEELPIFLSDIGDFSAEFYFSLKQSSKEDAEKFLYKHVFLSNRYDTGVVLYRNAFSISSYDGSKDWLGLGKRSRKSPAAATHPTGAWRVRENQISGKVQIDKKKNLFLQDLANRQGLNENTHYELFIKILDIGISEFERYRQSVIRLINKKNDQHESSEKKASTEFLKKPLQIKEFSDDEINQLATEFKSFQNEFELTQEKIEEIESRYKYDIQILNVLASLGLKASSLAHEMHNDRNNMNITHDCIISAMKQLNIW